MNSAAHNALLQRLHAALPQTQCTRCGFPDCAAYAQAMATGAAEINQCPPGGALGVQRLAEITGKPVLALNPIHGSEGPRAVAVIDEDWCIGCTLCLDACPTDAILGSNKVMHTVIEACCTGCELCIPVCPVDCISLENVSGERTGWLAWSQADADMALSRYEIHSLRRTSSAPSKPETPAISGSAGLASPAAGPASASAVADKKRAVIAAALASARAARQSKP